MNLKSINFDELKEITEPQIFDPPRKLPPSGANLLSTIWE